MIRIIANGKKAGLEEFRQAVYDLRQQGHQIEVRVTWEKGDAERLVREAVAEQVPRIAAAGGDGTLNEVVNGLCQMPAAQRPELALIPLGTANDFAHACTIPLNYWEAIELALTGTAQPIDVVQANERYFINVATGGFGSQVTANTSESLKNFLGGGAYVLGTVLRSLNFSPNHGRLLAEGVDLEGESVVGAVCNGRQAGGGQVLAPNAYINDGLLDILIILAFPLRDLPLVMQEVFNSTESGQYVKRFRSAWAESHPYKIRSVNLDGEPYQADEIRFEVLKQEIDFILPPACPLLAPLDKPAGAANQ